MSPPDSDRMVGTGGYHTRTSDAKCRVQGGVYLQDGRTQRQNFAQNGSQKLFCPGPEASDLVTKISTGIFEPWGNYQKQQKAAKSGGNPNQLTVE